MLKAAMPKWPAAVVSIAIDDQRERQNASNCVERMRRNAAVARNDVALRLTQVVTARYRWLAA